MPATRLPSVGGDLGVWGTVLNSYLSDRATAQWFDAVGDYGADPTGVADSTTAIQSAITAAIAYSSTGRGVVFIRPGQYKVSSTLTAATASKPIYIVGIDPQSCVINYTGSGDCIRMTNSGGGAGAEPGGGGIVGIGIDGNGASAGAVGLHFGDFDDARVEVKVARFHGAGSIGILLENTVWWTEHNFFKLHVYDCTQGVVLKVSGTGTNSFGYNTFDVRLNMLASQDGFVVSDGCVLYHAALRIRGNFLGSNSTGSQNFGILRLGTGGGGAHINQCLLEIFAETATWTFPPFSINFGVPGTDSIQGCMGIIDLTSGGNLFTPSNLTASTRTTAGFTYSGMIRGDINLCSAANVYFAPFFFTDVGARVHGQATFGVTGKVYSSLGDFFGPLVLNQNMTITLTPDGQSCLAGPQRKVIVIKQAAAGGPFTVAWPSTGSPTLAAPTVKWAGGAPTMSAGANAIDWYDLVTTDGITWYGRATQNVT